jgi:hypothetical protein
MINRSFSANRLFFDLNSISFKSYEYDTMAKSIPPKLKIEALYRGIKKGYR